MNLFYLYTMSRFSAV